MEDRIQKIIQTVTAGLILGMLAAVLFLMLLKSTGYTPTLLFGIGLVTVAFFLPQCLRILPEKWFYPFATAWTMSVTSLFVCSGYVLFVTGNTGHECCAVHQSDNACQYGNQYCMETSSQGKVMVSGYGNTE